MNPIAEDQLFRKGIMTKDPFDMTPEEEKQWQIEAQERAKVRIFAAGQPLVYEKNGQMIAEYANGKIEII
jgi:hypothetical protein